MWRRTILNERFSQKLTQNYSKIQNWESDRICAKASVDLASEPSDLQEQPKVHSAYQSCLPAFDAKLPAILELWRHSRRFAANVLLRNLRNKSYSQIDQESIKNRSRINRTHTKNKIDGNHMRLVEAALDGPHPREPLLEHKFHLRHRTNRSHQESAVRSLHLFYQIDHHVTMCSQCEVMFEIVGCTRAIGTRG